MGKHVDVVVTNWVDGAHTRVACFSLDGGVAHCELLDQRYEHLSTLELDFGDGLTVRAENGQAFLDALSDALDSTYVSVLPLHSDEECRFADSNDVAVGGEREIALA